MMGMVDDYKSRIEEATLQLVGAIERWLEGLMAAGCPEFVVMEAVPSLIMDVGPWGRRGMNNDLYAVIKDGALFQGRLVGS